MPAAPSNSPELDALLRKHGARVEWGKDASRVLRDATLLSALVYRGRDRMTGVVWTVFGSTTGKGYRAGMSAQLVRLLKAA